MSRPAVLVASLFCALPGGWLASLAWTLTTPVRVVLVLGCALVGALVAVALTGPAVHRPHPGTAPGTAVPRRAAPDAMCPGFTGRDDDRTDDGGGAERAALIAQCPRCGELRLDSGRQGAAYRFRCGNPACGHTWTWLRDQPWPPTVVRRNLPAGPTQPR